MTAFVAGMAAILSEYPAAVIDVVCDPRTGLARRLKWPPAIAEVAEACDAEMAPRREAEARRARTERQLRERAEHDALRAKAT